MPLVQSIVDTRRNCIQHDGGQTGFEILVDSTLHFSGVPQIVNVLHI